MPRGLLAPTFAFVGNKKTTRGAGGWNRSSGGLGLGLRLLLGLGQCQLALQIRDPAFPLLDLVELLSHKSLYNMNPIRMLGRDYADSSFSVQHLFAAGFGGGVGSRLQIN